MEKVIEKVSSKIEQEIMKQLSDAKNEAVKLIDKQYSQYFSVGRSKIEEIITKSEERVGGEKARADIELKISINNEKEYWLNRLKEELKGEIYNKMNREKYNETLEKIIVNSVDSNSVIYVAEKDEKIVKEILKKNKINSKTEIDNAIIGGVIIYHPDKGLRRDYTLNLILEQVFDSYIDKIASKLFG
ncbi:hypothetical protein HS7_08570 [Sulfolobales archaeon HS-7]|nr:hypothetical protein HS7_08570 [Sulfolobales archaeon HS-7]